MADKNIVVKGTEIANELTTFLTAIQPEAAAVIALVRFVSGLIKNRNPGLTNDQLNAALGPTLVQALAEAEILQAEIDKTKAEIAARNEQP